MENCQVVAAVVCDDVRREVGNKKSLMGLFTSFNVSDYQQPLPPFTVFVKLGFQDSGTYTVGFNVKSHEGDFGFSLSGSVEATTRNEAYQRYVVDMDVGLANLKVPREGQYFVEVTVDGQAVTHIPFVVKTRKPPVVQ